MAVCEEERLYLKKKTKRVPLDGIVVEVGSWTGQSSVAISKGIAKYCSGVKFYCVDIWSQEYYESTPGLCDAARKMDVKDVFEKNMSKYPHLTMQMKSTDAATTFKDCSIDMVFIDANHEYEYVKEDISAWWPKLKHGGLMCGHDYSIKFGGVIRAVKERFSEYSNPARTIWEVIK
jgi:predicted O-methyltransferase YrrM